MAYLNESQRQAAGLMTLGIPVDKASATVPQGAVQTIFTVAGGRVLVRLLLGEVTTILGATANNITVNTVPTVGTGYIIASAAEGNAAEAGCLLVVEGDGSALEIVGKAGAGKMTGNNGWWICPSGTINFQCVASTTGATKWKIWYFPLDDGASVVSA